MKNKLNLLVVEDDPNLGTILTEYLRAKDFEVTLKANGKEGFEQFAKDNYDLLILDVMMPVQDGFTMAEEVRKIDKEVPIIFLTAKSMKEDAIEGFKIGADDYVTKPFSMEELMMRVNAILRRTQRGQNESEEKRVFQIGDSSFDSHKQVLTVANTEKKLTSKENQLLKLLCLNKNNVLERESALKAIWGDDSYFNSRSMDVYITKLRKYLKEDEKTELINVHGRGFKLIELD
ncbi:MAG: response regulator transcription factor [Salibacter sp.]|uniref:response regulator transcription factor n=1 Tax=Salibacter sp. TaxID=2010995 RepID=UPI0028700AF7|nr:response regulator transcription factor [Salibacter sp.]MDR9397619.1 response regulator transcription factor [Salibacter sp.]